MNTKSKTIAVLMAAIMVSAVAVPMAMAIGIGDVIVDVVNNAPEVICKCEGQDEDDSRPGTQIWPNPDGPKAVTICACVCDPNSIEDINSVSAQVFYPDTQVKVGNVPMTPGTCTECTLYKPEVTQNPQVCDCTPEDTCQVYTGTFDMDPCDQAGEYRVVVTAMDTEANEDKMQNRFFYESWVLLEIDPPVIDFGSVEICTVSYADEIGIHNAGNDPAIVTVSTEGLSQDGGDGVIAPGDLDIAIDDEEHKWLSNDVTFDTILECCNWHELNFSIHVQQGTPSGTYTGSIEFTADHAPEMKLLFENKDASDKYLYDPNLGDLMTGDMDYSMDDCSYEFHGYGLDPQTEYCLIYYSEPWLTQGAGVNINSGTSGDTGYLQLSGTLPCMPIYSDTGDYEYDLAGGKYGKIWLVPCSDMTDGMLTGWSPSKILFEIETIALSCCPA